MSANTLLLFPGQGAQYPGIGSDLTREYPIARDIYSDASDILGYDLAALCNDAESGAINLTKFTQPVLLVHSYICLQVFQQHLGVSIDAFAAGGHSLGEYTALVAAGALSFEDALRLVSKRGECMGEHGGGEMLALSLTEDDIEPFIEASNCEIAALNLPEQTVVGGWPDELDQLTTNIDEKFPGKGGVRLKTEGAFHTSHMYPAAQKFRPFLEETHMRAPKLRVASNTTGAFHSPDIDRIRENLYLQLFNPVRWSDNLKAIMNAGVERIIEFGGGLGMGETPSDKRPNLQGMIVRTFRRANPRPAYHAVINVQTLEATCKAYTAT